MTSVLLLHPGEMGAAVGACLRAVGHDVAWLSAGRSPATRRRAEQAGLRPVEPGSGPGAGPAQEEWDVVLSVVPPAFALDTAQRAAAVLRGSRGTTYVDANAVSPQTAARVAAVVEAAGAVAVDGGIVGPPPRAPGTTRIFLSGGGAAAVAALFDGGPLQAAVLEGGPFAASALKLAYAAWTKGSAALLLAVWRAAELSGVDDALAQEWARSQPDLPDRLAAAGRAAEAKGWRWSEEMRQVAEAFTQLGVPGGFGEAAAAVYAERPRPADA